MGCSMNWTNLTLARCGPRKDAARQPANGHRATADKNAGGHRRCKSRDQGLALPNALPSQSSAYDARAGAVTYVC